MRAACTVAARSSVHSAREQPAQSDVVLRRPLAASVNALALISRDWPAPPAACGTPTHETPARARKAPPHRRENDRRHTVPMGFRPRVGVGV